jgi:hypothetical protein
MKLPPTQNINISYNVVKEIECDPLTTYQYEIHTYINLVYEETLELSIY